ncbi:MAG: hypothetical protein QNJ22_05680 [Desulfosarcinaceae bacterium]|nr:hypothetical protein [Desulfosarcinaceae bacterium]
MNASPSEHSDSALLTWFVVLLLLGVILAKGFLSFYVVGDLGQPDWDYRPVADLPGESPYAMYPPLPYPQHVRGAEGE